MMTFVPFSHDIVNMNFDVNTYQPFTVLTRGTKGAQELLCSV